MKKLIKKVAPMSYVIKAVKIFDKLDNNIIKIASKNKLFSNAYYFFNGEFTNEKFAVLKGRAAYHESLLEIGSSCSLLRRNIHRLEKGLIMKPRRSIFAEGFIQETIDCYKNAIKSQELEVKEKKWATDVLDEYFNVIGSSEVIDKAKYMYLLIRTDIPKEIRLESDFPSIDNGFKPYLYNDLSPSIIDFDDLKKLFIKRRSVRWYKDKPVPLELVQKAANIASFAPSACNRQPYRFFFCNDSEKTTKIANCAMGTVGFADNLPAIIAVIGDLSAYPADRDRHVIYIDGSLATMQLMLALETLGLSTCPINWPEINTNERAIRKVIKLKDYERVVMLLAVGYADMKGGIPYSQKKENNLVLKDIS